jgi:hypothetical protein
MARRNSEPSPYVWLLQNLDTKAKLVFTAEHLAMHTAERMVGNRAVALPGSGDTMLYGPGDGSTSVIIRRMTRELALRLDLDIPIE